MDKKLLAIVSSYSSNTSRQRPKSTARVFEKSEGSHSATRVPRRPDSSNKGQGTFYERMRWKLPQTERGASRISLMDSDSRGDSRQLSARGLTHRDSKMSMDRESRFLQTNSTKFNFE